MVNEPPSSATADSGFSIDPERTLMLAYVPAAKRAAIATLWRLDARLGQVVATTSNPAVGAIRLAWWRDALRRLDEAPPPAEPLLSAIAADLLPHVAGAMLAPLAEAWGTVLDADPTPEMLDEFGEERGGRLFALAADVLDGDPDIVRAAGAGWALVDLAFRSHDPVARGPAFQAARRALAEWTGPVPGRLRSIGMLGVLARLDVEAGAAADRRQGAPGRIARMLLYRLIGR